MSHRSPLMKTESLTPASPSTTHHTATEEAFVRITPSTTIDELNSNIERLEGLQGRLRSLLEELEEFAK